jgi:adenylate cyclase
MGADEEGMLERLKALRHDLLESGSGTKTTGDGLVVEFASVVDAVPWAVAVQQATPERKTGIAAESRIALRIGVRLRAQKLPLTPALSPRAGLCTRKRF